MSDRSNYRMYRVSYIHGRRMRDGVKYAYAPNADIAAEAVLDALAESESESESVCANPDYNPFVEILDVVDVTDYWVRSGISLTDPGIIIV